MIKHLKPFSPEHIAKVRVSMSDEEKINEYVTECVYAVFRKAITYTIKKRDEMLRMLNDSPDYIFEENKTVTFTVSGYVTYNVYDKMHNYLSRASILLGDSGEMAYWNRALIDDEISQI
jgi:hypothetical protein